MKVLHINTSNGLSGAAIAASRLQQGLLAQGITSRWLVASALEETDQVAVIRRSRQLEALIWRLTWRLGFNDLHCVSSFKIPQHPWYQAADVINLHNLHTGYFNYLALPHLTRHQPVIYTLHDMWSFTGHCIYSYDCDRWQTGCGQCPYPDSYPAVMRDTTHQEWQWKQWAYQRSNLVIVTLSRWLTEQAERSILNHFPIHHIPNGIDTAVYQPIDSQYCRSVLGLPADKKVLMFSAQSLADPRKGGDLLLKALQNLPAALKAETVLLTLGEATLQDAEALGMEIHNLGFVTEDQQKAIAYSAADLFVFPTRADNLPLVLQESMACGTPMVSFKVGGVPDLVRHGITGYLAAPAQADDFCAGIVELLENDDLRMQMGQQCREIALREYALEIQAQRYLELYRQTLLSSRKEAIAP